MNISVRKILPRAKQLKLLQALAREAGWRHVALLGLLSTISSLLDIAGLGVGVALLLKALAGFRSAVSLPAGISLLVGLIVLRGLLLAQVAIHQEQLRSGFTDRLRLQLLHQVFNASSTQLDALGRGDLLALLMADINRSALSLDQAVRMLQALLAMAIYLGSVLLVGRAAAWPLLLALLGTASAALLQRSGSWGLGRIQSRLNAALQRTVGNSLHSLKAVRAAAAEPWLLDRFTRETAEGRWLLREQVKRRANYNVWRDTLVVAIAGLWLLSQGEQHSADVLATTLLLAYRAGTSLSAVVQAQRLSLGNLPGYEALRKRRKMIQQPSMRPLGASISNHAVIALSTSLWNSLHWQSSIHDQTKPTGMTLQPNRLVVISGSSGSGKTTFLDRICGLRDEEHSHWQIDAECQAWQLSGSAGAKQLRQLIAYAPQNAVLLEASLRDNLLFGHLPPESIESWLQRLGLSHLLEREGGLDSAMSLAQDPFSGGEVHRLGLMRAWLRDLPVEVLDEPTAFLDAAAAEKVRNVIQERAQTRLVLVSSHDPDLLKLADQVIQITP